MTIRIEEETYNLINSLKGKDSFAKYIQKILPMSNISIFKQCNNYVNDISDSIEQNKSVLINALLLDIAVNSFRNILATLILDKDIHSVKEEINSLLTNIGGEKFGK